ncbi:right-handed parallel beta-helix repeat-containing protein [Olivibacter sitiensis]|uniref:right-handed parallel beta-helix repeat-containing protein n=1 Tax=Olivibacter sitiensis TaxID=376470 RepID=UPI000409036D|nr:right-handed parallel beta-helix repeat-containing protein [Olivibacter sitiensis]
MNKIYRFVIVVFILGSFSWGFGCSSSQTASEKSDSTFFGEDESKLFQGWIDSAQVGDTVYLPKGTHYVRTLRLRTGVSIVSEGLLKQLPHTEELAYSIEKQSSGRPLFRGDRVRDIYLQFEAETRQEAIYCHNSQAITIKQSKMYGDSTKLRSFAGMLFYGCDSITIENSEIAYYGMARKDAKKYQPGTGLRFLASRAIRVTGSHIHHNGENGIFFHECAQAYVEGNNISYNGMSGVQVAFGRNKIENDYTINHNRLEHNAADAIDINQPDKSFRTSIDARIQDNVADDNGLVKGESTVDGSGIATLVGVSSVHIKGNKSTRSNRPAIYLQHCDSIYAHGNEADQVMEMVGENGTVTLDKNKLAGVRLLQNVQTKKLVLTNNDIRTLSFPNGIQVDSLLLYNNTLKGVVNVNMKGVFLFRGNTLYSPSAAGALLLTKVDGAAIKGNQIESTKAPAISVEASARNVLIEDNDIKSVKADVYSKNAEGLVLRANRFQLIK